MSLNSKERRKHAARIELCCSTMMQLPMGKIAAVCCDNEPDIVAYYGEQLNKYPSIVVMDHGAGPVEGVYTYRINRKQQGMG